MRGRGLACLFFISRACLRRLADKKGRPRRDGSCLPACAFFFLFFGRLDGENRSGPDRTGPPMSRRSPSFAHDVTGEGRLYIWFAPHLFFFFLFIPDAQ